MSFISSDFNDAWVILNCRLQQHASSIYWHLWPLKCFEFQFKSTSPRKVKKYNPTILLSFEEYTVKQSEGKVAIFSVWPSLIVVNCSLELLLRTNTACRLPTYHDGWRDCYSAFLGSARLPSRCLLRWPLFSGRLEESPLSDWNKWDILKLRH